MKKQGSATVEALLILPIAFFFIYSMIWMIDVFRIHTEVGAIVNEAGNQMVEYSYPLNVISEKAGGEEKNQILSIAGSVAYNEIYVRGKIEDSDVADKIDKLICITGVEGEKDVVSITVNYYVTPYLEIPGFEGMYLTNSFYSKAFVGYERDENKEEYVYVTKGSSVYHTSKECSGIKTTIEAEYLDKIDECRNENGGKYYPCEKCGKEVGYICYVTPYGNRYHSDPTCKELKVNLYRIPISEIGGRRKCYFCK